MNIRNFFKKSDFISSLYTKRKTGMSFKRIFYDFFNFKKANILFVGSVYYYAEVFRNGFMSSQGTTHFLGDTDYSKEEENKDFLSLINKKWSLQVYGFDIKKTYTLEIRKIASILNGLLKSYKKSLDLVSKHKVLLTSCLLFPRQQLLAHICQSQGKDVIVYTHGSKGYTKALLSDESNDLYFSSKVLTFGPQVNEYYKKTYPEYKIQYHDVGLGNDYNQKVENGEYILYATGKYLVNITLIHEVGDQDEILYNIQKELVSYFEKQTFLPVVYKLNPTPFLGDTPHRSAKLKEIRYGESFSSLVKKAKCIVLDSPTTAVIECANSKIPIFALFQRVEYTEEAMNLVKKRVSVAYTPKELIKNVEQFLKEGTYSADLENRDFSNAFGKFAPNVSQELAKIILDSMKLKGREQTGDICRISAIKDS